MNFLHKFYFDTWCHSSSIHIFSVVYYLFKFIFFSCLHFPLRNFLFIFYLRSCLSKFYTFLPLLQWISASFSSVARFCSLLVPLSFFTASVDFFSPFFALLLLPRSLPLVLRSFVFLLFNFFVFLSAPFRYYPRTHVRFRNVQYEKRKILYCTSSSCLLFGDKGSEGTFWWVFFSTQPQK